MASKAKPSEFPAGSLHGMLDPIRDALKQSCHRPDLAWQQVGYTSASKILYALAGLGSISARTDRVCILNQLFPKTKPELWLGIILELRKLSVQNLYEAVHVSIQAFEGATSQTLEPLLRAEWDSATSKSKHGPAQPHWHAYAKSSIMSSNAFLQSHTSSTTTPQPLANVKGAQHKVHFALCANWHKQGESHFEVFSTPDEIRRWVVGAIDYIRSQV